MEFIKCIFILLGIAAVLFLIGVKIIARLEIRRNWQGNHHCRSCEKSFVYFGDENYTYCPYCGGALTEYETEPETDPFDTTEEDRLRRENSMLKSELESLKRGRQRNEEEKR